MKFSTSTLLTIIAACAAQSVNAFDWGTICTDVGFVGTCTTYQADANKCVNFTGKDGFWNDKVSSISVVGGAKCFFYTNTQCSGDTDTYMPGRHNSVTRNDQYSSFRCVFAV